MVPPSTIPQLSLLPSPDLLDHVCVSGSVMSNLWDPWTVAHQAPLSMEFYSQEYWSGLPFPSPGDLPNPRIEPGSPACRPILYHLSY